MRQRPQGVNAIAIQKPPQITMPQSGVSLRRTSLSRTNLASANAVVRQNR